MSLVRVWKFMEILSCSSRSLLAKYGFAPAIRDAEIVGILACAALGGSSLPAGIIGNALSELTRAASISTELQSRILRSSHVALRLRLRALLQSTQQLLPFSFNSWTARLVGWACRSPVFRHVLNMSGGVPKF